MPEATIISDQVRTVDATAEGERLLVSADRLEAAVGWELKPEGLCRAQTCVPVRDRESLLVGDDVDIAAVAAALGRAAVVDAGASLAAIALDAEGRRQALHGLQAPGFTLPDLDGAMHGLDEWRGRKKLLVAFASW